MAGRTGEYDEKTGKWSRVIYMPCTAENQFVPELPEETPDLIYLCVPNNPTGTTLTRDQLKVWVDYANRTGAVILMRRISQSRRFHTPSSKSMGPERVP